jgi:CubicO group peptidase (beta-lactamase class C family)
VADVASGRPLTSDALFRIASMTKPVTSVALMQLVEQGRIGLDDPAEKYLPELAGLKVLESFDVATGAYQVRPASRPATVKHFLTHTSGLAYPFTSAPGAISSRAPAKLFRSADRCCSIRASAGTTAPLPMWSASWSRRCPARSSRIISASTSLPR